MSGSPEPDAILCRLCRVAIRLRFDQKWIRVHYDEQWAPETCPQAPASGPGAGEHVPQDTTLPQRMFTEKLSYPEHEKLSAVKVKSQAIGEFLEYLFGERGMTICHYNDWIDQFEPVDGGDEIEGWLADFFKIDREALEDEKTDMLRRVSMLNEAQEATGDG